MMKGAFLRNLTGKGWICQCFDGIVFFEHKLYVTCINKLNVFLLKRSCGLQLQYNV